MNTDIIIIKLRNKHNRIFARTEDRWFEITGCEADLSGVLAKAKEVSAQYVADLYARSNRVKAKASKIKKLTREKEATA